jgi:nitrogen fixation protein NifX
MSKVAVASTDGVLIDEHFGRTKQFFIYEVKENGEYVLTEKRQNIAAQTKGSVGHPSDAVIKLVVDVEAVLAAQIGQGAERELRRLGILALSVTGSLDKALRTYGQRSKLIQNITKA